MTPLQGAMSLASAGYHLFPVRSRGKEPLVADWEANATTDLNKIEAWSKAYPDCNWGVACGPSSLLVADLDNKNGKSGLNTWRSLCRAASDQGHDLQPTFRVRTPSGGEHLYFKGAGKNTVGALGPGVDTRGQGGYVVAPFSVLEAGVYTTIDDRPCAEVPVWLSTAMEGAKKAPLDRPDDAKTENSIRSGERNAMLARWAGLLRGNGLTQREIQAALAEINVGRCSPPLDDEEVDAISKSIARYERGAASALAAFGVEQEVNTDLVISAADEMERKLPNPDQVLADFIDSGDFMVLLGKSKARKSWALFQMAVCLATGQPFLSWETLRPRKVLLVQLEVKRDHYARRLRSVATALQAPLSLLKNLHIINGRGRRGSQRISLPIVEQQAEALKAEVVIIDPLYWLIQGEENTAEGLRPLVEGLLSIAESGPAVIVAHHDPKGQPGDRDIVDRGSGSGVLGRAFDASMSLMAHSKDPDAQVLEAISRNYPSPDALTVRFNGGILAIDGDLPAMARTSSDARRHAAKGPTIEELIPALETALEGQKSVFVDQVGTVLERIGVSVGVNKARQVAKGLEQKGGWSIVIMGKGGKQMLQRLGGDAIPF